jgi:hypothetical protein
METAILLGCWMFLGLLNSYLLGRLGLSLQGPEAQGTLLFCAVIASPVAFIVICVVCCYLWGAKSIEPDKSMKPQMIKPIEITKTIE